MKPPWRLAQSAKRATIARPTHQRGRRPGPEMERPRQTMARSATSREKITTVKPAARGWITASNWGSRRPPPRPASTTPYAGRARAEAPRRGDQERVEDRQSAGSKDLSYPEEGELGEPLLVEPGAPLCDRGERIVLDKAVLRHEPAADQREIEVPVVEAIQAECQRHDEGEQAPISAQVDREVKRPPLPASRPITKRVFLAVRPALVRHRGVRS